MKKLLLFSAIALSLYSCSKSNKSDNKPTTWITGKWYLETAYNDTVANSNKVDGAIYHDVLTFVDATNVTSLGAKATFQYSLSSMTVNENGEIFKIKQISDTEMTLTDYVGIRLFDFKKQN